MTDKLLHGWLATSKTKATFFGIDWGSKDWSALQRPHCKTPHRWRRRKPKHCRHCGVKFLFTASEPPHSQPCNEDGA